MTGDGDPVSSVVELDRVNVWLGGRRVLADVSLRVGQGEFVGIIGSNGAGKTTLLRVILGLLRPASGTVSVHGPIGYTPQSRLFDRDTPLSARDLVGLGLDGHRWGIGLAGKQRQARINDALCAVDAAGYADSPVGQLSGGQQQRLSIAQALLADPRLLLLDEPLSSLDVRSQKEIVDLVAGLSRERGVAVLFVTHGVNPLLAVLDRVCYLANGRAAIGTVNEVIRPDVLSNLYGSPVEVVEANGRIFVASAEGQP
ncbi:MAG: metal ABC transporter ATP-binding protein [Chloroflexota bacterium]